MLGPRSPPPLPPRVPFARSLRTRTTHSTTDLPLTNAANHCAPSPPSLSRPSLPPPLQLDLITYYNAMRRVCVRGGLAKRGGALVEGGKTSSASET